MIEKLTKCPCCGFEALRRYPLVSLERNQISWDGRIITVSARQAEIMFVMVQAAPRLASYELLCMKAFEVGHDSVDLVQLLRQHVALLRARIEPLGIGIFCVRERGFVLEFPGRMWNDR